MALIVVASLCGAVRCAALQCAMQCGAVRCSAVQCGAVRCGAVRCGAVWARLTFCIMSTMKFTCASPCQSLLLAMAGTTASVRCTRGFNDVAVELNGSRSAAEAVTETVAEVAAEWAVVAAPVT